MSSSAVTAGALTGNTLVLNKGFLPIHVTSVRRAISLLYRGVARAVDGEYQTFDFNTWADLRGLDSGYVGTQSGSVPVPRVILLSSFDRLPIRRVRFNRHNIFLRDQNTCQYCAERLPRNRLNLDHVVPRAAGGGSSWENVVCSCFECNRRKGGRTPRQAGMKLLREPRRPQWAPFLARQIQRRGHNEWRPFLGGIDAAYWNTELLQD